MTAWLLIVVYYIVGAPIGRSPAITVTQVHNLGSQERCLGLGQQMHESALHNSGGAVTTWSHCVELNPGNDAGQTGMLPETPRRSL